MWVTLIGHLPADSPIRQVSLYAETPSGDLRPLKTGDVDAGGDLALRVRALESTTYVGKILGSAGYVDMVASASSYRERLRWDRDLVGFRMRLRVEWRGDARNGPANSPCRYVRYAR